MFAKGCRPGRARRQRLNGREQAASSYALCGRGSVSGVGTAAQPELLLARRPIPSSHARAARAEGGGMSSTSSASSSNGRPWPAVRCPLATAAALVLTACRLLTRWPAGVAD